MQCAEIRKGILRCAVSCLCVFGVCVLVLMGGVGRTCPGGLVGANVRALRDHPQRDGPPCTRPGQCGRKRLAGPRKKRQLCVRLVCAFVCVLGRRRHSGSRWPAPVVCRTGALLAGLERPGALDEGRRPAHHLPRQAARDRSMAAQGAGPAAGSDGDAMWSQLRWRCARGGGGGWLCVDSHPEPVHQRLGREASELRKHLVIDHPTCSPCTAVRTPAACCSGCCCSGS